PLQTKSCNLDTLRAFTREGLFIAKRPFLLHRHIAKKHIQISLYSFDILGLTYRMNGNKEPHANRFAAANFHFSSDILMSRLTIQTIETAADEAKEDRKSVVEGKSVEHGGGRSI